MAKGDLHLRKPLRHSKGRYSSKPRQPYLLNPKPYQTLVKTTLPPPTEVMKLNNTNNDYIIQHVPTNDTSLGNGRGYVTLISSPNDILNISPSHSNKDNWDEDFDPNVCRTIAGLNKQQLELCKK